MYARQHNTTTKGEPLYKMRIKILCASSTLSRRPALLQVGYQYKHASLDRAAAAVVAIWCHKYTRTANRILRIYDTSELQQ